MLFPYPPPPNNTHTHAEIVFKFLQCLFLNIIFPLLLIAYCPQLTVTSYEFSHIVKFLLDMFSVDEDLH